MKYCTEFRRRTKRLQNVSSQPDRTLENEKASEQKSEKFFGVKKKETIAASEHRHALPAVG
jgi:hypothetical protein